MWLSGSYSLYYHQVLDPGFREIALHGLSDWFEWISPITVVSSSVNITVNITVGRRRCCFEKVISIQCDIYE